MRIARTATTGARDWRIWALCCGLALAAGGCAPDGGSAPDGRPGDGDESGDAPPGDGGEPGDAPSGDGDEPGDAPSGDGDEPGDAPSGDGDEPRRPRFQVCDQDPEPTGLPLQDWEHTSTPLLVTSQGSARHSAQDIITVVGHAVSIVGKFAYGPFSKDLQDERVEVYLDLCHGELVRLGEARTDSDGRIAFELSAAALPPVGAYSTWLRVLGDGSSTRSMLRVALPGTRVAVMDIDGTLTTDDLELFQDIFADFFAPLGAGDYVPEARAGAVALTERRGIEQGYLLVYLTGRPYYLTDITREWITAQALAPAHLHVTDSNGEAMPTEGGVGSYKATYLAFLQALGLALELAYGNASTDIYAYEQAGVAKAATFIAGPNGGEAGTMVIGDDYLQHLGAIAAEPTVAQPFEW